ncbi:MAG: hypothetical protein IKW30_00455 [Lachnospiraceae bacterium]|nr:hypothetical protein [Lachnospiraceae bacterium]
MNSNVKNALNEAEMYDKKCLLADFLNRYYIYEIEESELSFWEEEIFIPLEERKSGVFEALEYLVPRERNINNESAITALELAVGHIDYYMAEYLIAHGANPNFWEEREEELKEPGPHNNWYLEDLDVAVINDLEIEHEVVYEHVLKLIKLLTEAGELESFSGLCLAYDSETGEIELHKLRMKY